MEIGALSVDRFYPKRQRAEFAAALNALLASPSFASWREGAPLDVGGWLTAVRVPAALPESAEELSEITKCLAPRWFVMRDVHARHGTVLMQPRWAMSYRRGPMTGAEGRRVREGREREPGLGAPRRGS